MKWPIALDSASALCVWKMAIRDRLAAPTNALSGVRLTGGCYAATRSSGMVSAIAWNPRSFGCKWSPDCEGCASTHHTESQRRRSITRVARDRDQDASTIERNAETSRSTTAIAGSSGSPLGARLRYWVEFDHQTVDARQAMTPPERQLWCETREDTERGDVCPPDASRGRLPAESWILDYTDYRSTRHFARVEQVPNYDMVGGDSHAKPVRADRPCDGEGNGEYFNAWRD